MKKLVFVIISLITYGTWAQSPWILQHANGLEGFSDPSVIFSPVNEEICWGINTRNAQFLRTTDGGTNWSVSTVTSELLNGTSIFAIDENTAWVSMKNTSLQTGGIFKSTNGGVSWTKHSSIFTGGGGTPNLIHFFDADAGIAVGNPRGNPANWEIYTTTDGGDVWSQVPSGNIPMPLFDEESIPGKTIGAGNTFWFSTFHGSLYRTTDRGITWTVTRSVMGAQVGFGFTFKDTMNGLACTFVNFNKVSQTSDGGTTWTQIFLNPPGLNGVSPFYISYAKGSNNLYVITAHSNTGGQVQASPGSAYSTGNLAHWEHVDYLPHGNVSFASERIGWSAGLNDSIYKWDSDLIPTSVEENNNKLEAFSLQQNYPNPFNPSSNIEFTVAEEANVTLEVFNILGEPVAVLINEALKPGIYNVTFEGSSLASGVYLYRLQAGNFIQTRKMTLFK